MGRLRERRNWREDRKRKKKERDRMKREERMGDKTWWNTKGHNLLERRERIIT